MNQQLKLEKYRCLVHAINRQIKSGVARTSIYSKGDEYANSTLDLIFTKKEIMDSYIKILKYDSKISLRSLTIVGNVLSELRKWFEGYGLGTVKYGDKSAARKLIDAQQCDEEGRYQLIFWWLMAVTSSQLEQDVKAEKISLICDFASAFKIKETELEDIVNVLKFIYRESDTLTFHSQEVEGVFSELKSLYY